MSSFNPSDEFDIFEGMTSISAIIRNMSERSNERRIVKLLYDRTKADAKRRELHFLEAVSRDLGFSLEATDASEIDALTSGTTHGGFVALCTKRQFPLLNDNFLTNGSFYVLIEGIEDPYNFGYSVRSLYAAGVDGIVLPPRNWMELSGTVARSSAGTSELANICVSDPVEAVEFFKSKGFQIACAGIRNSVPLYSHDFSEKPVLLVVGGEKRGISRKILDLADVNIRIEYGRRFMGSLPTSAAVSVIAFEIARQKKLL